jgi:RNA polymerase sigma-70 factor (ECF subfamily)
VAAQVDDSQFSHRREELSKLYEQYRNALRRFFVRRRREHADDLMQALYLEVLSSRPSDGMRDPVKYLFGMAQHTLQDDYRSSRREHSRFVTVDPEDLKSVPETGGAWSATTETPTSPDEEKLEAWLSELPRACQAALLLSRRDERSYKEIAEQLGVSVHTVKKYLVKAMNHVRMRLRDDLTGAKSGS